MKKGVNDVGVVSNTGLNTLKALLQRELAKSTSADIAVAFVTKSGLNAILPAIKRVAMSGQVRLLTGLYQCVTEPDALRELLIQQEQSSGRLQVRLSTNKRFHWKAYFVEGRTNATVVIGSSNMTNEGLTVSGELSLAFSVASRSGLFKELQRPFNAEWEEAKPLNQRQIDLYRKSRPTDAGRATRTTVPLSKILGKLQPRSSAPKSLREPRLWRDWLQGEFDPKTEQVLDAETDWDKKGYWYQSITRPIYERGDRVVIFDFLAQKLYCVEVKETTRTATQTPAGRYFVAYRVIKNSRVKRFTANLWRRLRANGLVQGREAAKQVCRLSPDQWNAYRRLVR